MRTASALLISCLLFGLTFCCQAGEEQVELKGIVRLGDTNLALFKLMPSQRWGVEQAVLLKERQRESQLEILHIDANAGMVKARLGGAATEFALPPESNSETLISPSPASSNPAAKRVTRVRLHGADTATSLLLYETLVERTLLRRSNLPALELSLRSREPMSTAGLARQMERLMAEQGVFTRADRDKFMVVGSEQELGKVTPELWALSGQISPGESATQINPAQIQPGQINFPRTDMNQVLGIFQELTGRGLIKPSTLPAPAVTLRTANPLSRQEAVYSFLAVLALNDISFRPAGGKFLFAFPTVQSNKAATVLSRKMLSHGQAAQRMVEPTEQNPGLLGLPELVRLYEDLSGEKIEVPDGLPQVHFGFRLQSAVPTDEVLNALELVLAWNDLELTSQPGSKGLKLSKRESGG